MDELIKRANQGPDNSEDQDTDPEPEDTSESDEQISILEESDEQGQTADEDLLDTDGRPTNDPEPADEPAMADDEQHTETSDEPDEATPIETADTIGKTGQNTAQQDTAQAKTEKPEQDPGTDATLQDRQDEANRTKDDHGEKPSLEDEKIDKLKDKASDDSGSDENPYEASKERFQSLKQKEKEQFLKRDQASKDTGSSDSLKDKYDSYSDGNVLH